MPPNQQDQMSGHYGCIVVQSGSDETGPFQAIQVNEDAVINTLQDQDGNNILSNYNLSSQTLKSGIILTPQRSDVEFKKLGVSSGTIIGFYSVNA